MPPIDFFEESCVLPENCYSSLFRYHKYILIFLCLVVGSGLRIFRYPNKSNLTRFIADYDNHHLPQRAL